MNNVLVTIAPAMEALTRVYARHAARQPRDDEFRQVSERAIQEPARRCRLFGGHRLGGVTEERREGHNGQHRQHNRSVCASDATDFPANSAGTKTSSQRRGLCRISCSSRFIARRCRATRVPGTASNRDARTLGQLSR